MIGPGALTVFALLALPPASDAQEPAAAQVPPATTTNDYETRIRALEEQAASLERRVVIHVKGSSIKSVVPDEKHLCKNPRANCGTEIEWNLTGKLKPGWRVLVAEKATSPKKDCFKPAPPPPPPPPSARPTFALTDKSRRVSSGSSYCQTTGDEWTYDVLLVNGSGGVEDKVDPLVVIDWD
jgi:hypothetical protein